MEERERITQTDHKCEEGQTVVQEADFVPLRRKKKIGVLMTAVTLLFLGVSFLMAFVSLNGVGVLDSYVLNSMLVTFLCIFVPSLIFIYVKKAKEDSFNLNRLSLNQIIPCIFIGIGLFFAATGLNAAFITLLDMIGVNTGNVPSSPLPDLTSTPVFYVSVFCICILPAIAEELLCRGAMLYSVRSLGMHKAALLTGIFFALMHGSIISLPIYILLGYIFGVTVYKTRSVISSVIVHFVYNFCALEFSALAMEAEQLVQSESAAATAEASLSDVFVVAGIMLLVGVVILSFAWRSFLKNCKKNDEKEAEENGITPQQLQIAYNGETGTTLFARIKRLRLLDFVTIFFPYAVFAMLCLSELAYL